MNTIDRIYSNEIGISFFWKKNREIPLPKIQLVFRDIGFLLTLNELKDFSSSCNVTRESQCINNAGCRSLLLRTPSDKIDLAVNKTELIQIQELINGTIFRIELQRWVKNVGLN